MIDGQELTPLQSVLLPGELARGLPELTSRLTSDDLFSLEKLTPLFKLMDGGEQVRLADLGCGTGQLIIELACLLRLYQEISACRGQFEAWGLDLNPLVGNIDYQQAAFTLKRFLDEFNLSAEEKQRVQEILTVDFCRSTKVRFVKHDLNTLPDEVQSLDLATSLETAQYLPDKLGFADQVVSRVKEGGLAAISGLRDYLIYIKDQVSGYRVPFEIVFPTGKECTYRRATLLTHRVEVAGQRPFEEFCFTGSVDRPVEGMRCAPFEKLSYYEFKPKQKQPKKGGIFLPGNFRL